ncbi:Poly [ADP-ribose] polymerase 16, partial [Ophiophagus hannah]
MLPKGRESSTAQGLLGMPAPSHDNAAPTTEGVREIIRKDLLAADLKCSLFASALQSYKRDSALRPFPGHYSSEDSKDFESLVSCPLPARHSTHPFPVFLSQLSDTGALGSLQELLDSPQNPDQRTLELFHWILSSKAWCIHSTDKNKYEKIQELTGAPSMPVPVPDFLFEITYCKEMNAKFEDTQAGRDLIYAFHGSRLENFHSIMHNGLQCHLNRTSLFGEGTYLTSDLSLALLYSPHSLGWQRSAMGPILSCVAVCEVIDHPDVKCQVKKKDSREIDRKRARVKNSEGGDVPQKYFVVTNNQLIRVKYLLIYSQRQHRR